MKYRDHSLRYVPRRGVQKPTRQPQSAPLPQQPSAEESGHFQPVTHDEPLFHVDEKTPRIDAIKDTLGGLYHAIVEVLFPFTKKHTKHALAKAQPFVSGKTKSVANKVSHISKKVPVSKTRAIQICAVVILFAAGYAFAHRTSPAISNNPTATNQSKNNEPVGGTTPSYDTLLPKGKSIETLGGWKRVSPNSSNPVFAFVDTLERVEISVSEQPLPSTFSNNPDEDVKDLAQGFNANERVVADDATVYFVGTSVKGPQSVILTKKGVLILIKAPIQIKNEVWSAYIANLQ